MDLLTGQRHGAFNLYIIKQKKEKRKSEKLKHSEAVDLTAVGGTISMSLLICVHTHTHAHVFWCSPDAWAGSDMSVCLLCFDCYPPCRGAGGLMLSQWTQLRHPRTSTRTLPGPTTLPLKPPSSCDCLIGLPFSFCSSLSVIFFLLLLTEPVCCMRLKGLSAQLDVGLRCQNKY